MTVEPRRGGFKPAPTEIREMPSGLQQPDPQHQQALSQQGRTQISQIDQRIGVRMPRPHNCWRSGFWR